MINYNPFAQHIGIWYKDRALAEKLFDIMFKWFVDADYLERSVKNRNEMYFLFVDGTIIRFCFASESNRGNRFSISYLLGDIDNDIIDYVIDPITILGPACILEIPKELIVNDENSLDEDSLINKIICPYKYTKKKNYDLFYN